MCSTKGTPLEKDSSDEDDYERISQASEPPEGQEAEDQFDRVEDCETNKIAALEAALAKASLENARLVKRVGFLIFLGTLASFCLLCLPHLPTVCPAPPVPEPCPVPEPPIDCPAPVQCHEPPKLGAVKNTTLVWPNFEILGRFISKTVDRYDNSYYVGHEILSIEGVDVRDKHEADMREMFGSEEKYVTLTTRSNRFAFHGVVMAYERGWKESTRLWATAAAVVLVGSAILIVSYWPMKEMSAIAKSTTKDHTATRNAVNAAKEGDHNDQMMTKNSEVQTDRPDDAPGTKKSDSLANEIWITMVSVIATICGLFAFSAFCALAIGFYVKLT